MTTSVRRAARRPAQRDAIALLKHDHRLVKGLFSKFASAGTKRERKVVAHGICKIMAMHMAAEEQIIYPRAHKLLANDHSICEAEVEHTVAKVLIADIESFGTTDKRFDATMKILCEYTSHHFKAEETNLFPQLTRTSLDLVTLGIELAARRVELIAQEASIENVPRRLVPQQRSHRTDKRGRAAMRWIDSLNPNQKPML